MVPLKGQGDDIVNWRSEDSVTFHIFQAIDTRLKQNKRTKIKIERKKISSKQQLYYQTWHIGHFLEFLSKKYFWPISILGPNE